MVTAKKVSRVLKKSGFPVLKVEEGDEVQDGPLRSVPAVVRYLQAEGRS